MVISYTTQDMYFSIPEKFPFDRYSMEQSFMTSDLAKRKPGTCWPLYIKNSHKTPGLGHSFGFLKVSSAVHTGSKAVHIYILPYNFPRCWKLLESVFYKGRRVSNVSPNWIPSFLEYLFDVPPYYYEPIRFLLTTLKLGDLLPFDLKEINYSNMPKYRIKLKTLVGVINIGI